MHRLALFGYDQGGRQALENIGFSLRPARRGSDGWRFETACKDMATIQQMAKQIASTLDDVSIRPSARLGANRVDLAGNSLPFTAASSVRPGMVMFDGHGDYDVVETVERIELDRPVYDLDIEHTHNFIANGIVTHNSIYGFRGADITQHSEFEDTFPDAHVVKLEQNYRSTQTILDAANAVIRNNRGQKPKSLWTELGQGDPIKVRELDDEHAEARYVTGEIQRLVDEGTSRAEIAVFYRTNAQSRVLEDTLVRAEIAYQVIGGTKFYERAEIKDAIAYLTTLVNPQDVGAFTRIVNSPRRGIGSTSISRLLAHANTTGETVWELAVAPEEVPGLGAAAIKALRRFMGTMDVLRERVETGRAGVELLNEILQETGYLEALEAERTIEAQGGSRTSRSWSTSPPSTTRSAGDRGSLAEFLEQVALVADADDASRRRGAGDADDAPQRQGARVPDRVHDRLRGGCVPALAGARRGRPRGGAPALLRRHHARRARPVPDLGPHPNGVRSAQLRGPEPVRERDPRRAHRSRAAGAEGVRIGSARGRRRGGAAAPTCRRGDAPAPAAFRLGRRRRPCRVRRRGRDRRRTGRDRRDPLRDDRSERKLVADLAPISKR